MYIFVNLLFISYTDLKYLSTLFDKVFKITYIKIKEGETSNLSITCLRIMNTTLNTRFISSLEKCFVEESISSKPELKSISTLRNERYSFCIAYQETDKTIEGKAIATFMVESNIQANISVKKVDYVPVMMAAYHHRYDDNYLKRTSGLYPDLLTPYHHGDPLYLVPNDLNALWITIEPNEDISAGKFELTAKFIAEDGTLRACKQINIEVIDAILPEQTISIAQWLHADCLSSYYHVDALSDAHFEILENFISTAVKYGVNQILTPVITPPLDTAVGGERPTVQLVDINFNHGVYSFSYEKFDRFIEMCNRLGVKTFEICHLFTQWGANHAPKVMATVDGTYRQIFGWDTDAFSEEYKTFLRTFLTELIKHMDSLGIEKNRVVFHISDEPSLNDLDNYLKAKEMIADILCDYRIMDALSNYEFYEKGIVTNPIPANDHMEKFIEHDVPNLWTYYCCGQCVDVSNRFISMPSARNRIIATQLYKYNIAGFLQWGYNFYYNQFSKRLIDPYRVTDAEYFAPAGDAFSVYPSIGRTAYESIRLVVFYDALQDLRAMQLCEQLYSKEYVLNLIEGELAHEITFKEFPHSAEYIINLRDAINQAIKKKTNHSN